MNEMKNKFNNESEKEIYEKIDIVISEDFANLYHKIPFHNESEAINFINESLFNLMMKINNINSSKTTSTDLFLKSIIMALDINNNCHKKNQFNSFKDELNTMVNDLKSEDACNTYHYQYNEIFKKITYFHAKCLNNCFNNVKRIEYDNIKSKIESNEYEYFEKIIEQNIFEGLKKSNNIVNFIKKSINAVYNDINNVVKRSLSKNKCFNNISQFALQCMVNIRRSDDYINLSNNQCFSVGWLGIIYENKIEAILFQSIEKKWYEKQKDACIIQVNQIANEVYGSFLCTQNLFNKASSRLKNINDELNKINELITLCNNSIDCIRENSKNYNMFNDGYDTMNRLLKWNEAIINEITINSTKIKEIHLRSKKRMTKFFLVLFVVVIIVVVIFWNIYDE